MNEKKIVFFIENNSHLRFLKNVVIEYSQITRNLEIVSLEKLSFMPNVKQIVLNNNIEKVTYLKNLACDMFFTTTPNIGTSFFPKSSFFPSEKRPTYVYIFHSLVSPTEMYKKNSFKNFDYIISPSLTVTSQIKNLISKYTKILTFGYPMFDNIEPFKFKNIFSKSILIAPSWGDYGLSKHFLSLDNITYPEGYEVVFRPHPMDLIKFKDIKFNNLLLDNNLHLDNLHSYEMLVTDCSGIALEYFYLTGRPSLFINVPKKIKRRRKKSEEKYLLLEDEMKNTIGEVVEFEKLEHRLRDFRNINVDLNFVNEYCLSKNVVEKITTFSF
jgi:hypothetical protein